MKICIVAPSLAMGGVERASVTLANHFVSRSHQTFFVPVITKEHFFRLDPSVTVVEPEFNVGRLRVARSVFWMRRAIRKIDPDVVLAFNNVYGAIVLLATLGTSYKVCVSDRSSPLFKWPWQMAWFSNFAFFINPPDALISQTEFAASYARKKHRGHYKHTVIPNGLRETVHYPVTRKKVVLAVGRLNDPLKGFDRLIKAFAKIPPSDWRLVFAGGDQNAKELKALAGDCQISDRVDFLGSVKDIDRVYCESGIFVIPSRSEGFPNALCEAMAAGMPCVSFDFKAGPREIITDGEDGLLVEDGNIEALSNAIHRLMHSDELRSQLNERAKISSKRFDARAIGDQFLNFLKAI